MYSLCLFGLNLQTLIYQQNAILNNIAQIQNDKLQSSIRLIKLSFYQYSQKKENTVSYRIISTPMQYDLESLIIYKNKQQITNTQSLPVPHSNRICTDLFCTIISTIFALAMLIIAIINFDLNKLTRTTYPTDIQGRFCTLDNNAYNYLYFTSPNDITKRLCVQSCPKSSDQKVLKCLPSDQLSCRANDVKQFQVMIYESEEKDTSMGLFCWPKDQKIKSTILKNSKLEEKFLFVSAFRSIWYSAACSIGLGIIFLLLTSFLPGVMVYASVILGGVGCIALGVLLLVSNSQLLHVYLTLKIIFCVILIIIGILCLLSIILNARDLLLCTNYLRYAGNFFAKSIFLTILVFVFYVLTIGLIALMIFQTLAYWSHGQLTFNKQQIHKSLGDTYSIIMIVICGIEFYWGLAFLKQSFNFLISSSTVYYYFKQAHSFGFAIGNLFKFHWGSVVAGSFLINFFYLMDLFYDLLRPKNQSCLPLYNSLFCCCDRLLGLARSDALSFISLIGQPYCNSARYCQQIDQRSSFFDGSQSIFKFFRLGSHVMLASISTFLTYIFMLKLNNQISVLALIFSFFVNMFVVTYFVSLISQMAQAILLCTLVQSYIKNQNQIPIKYGKNKFSQANSKFTSHKNQSNLVGQGGYTIHQTHA